MFGLPGRGNHFNIARISHLTLLLSADLAVALGGQGYSVVEGACIVGGSAA